jgi:hypothetical protein
MSANLSSGKGATVLNTTGCPSIKGARLRPPSHGLPRSGFLHLPYSEPDWQDQWPCPMEQHEDLLMRPKFARSSANVPGHTVATLWQWKRAKAEFAQRNAVYSLSLDLPRYEARAGQNRSPHPIAFSPVRHTDRLTSVSDNSGVH